MTENPPKSNDDPVIDPDLKEELEETPAEDPFLTEYMTGQGGKSEESLRFIEKWFPDEDEWEGKTNIEAHQAHSLAIVRNMEKFFDELEPIMPLINSTVEDYEMYLTSIEGEARKEHVDILRTLFGGPQTDETESRSALMAAFANNMQDEE